jgi:hypothetical protein
VAYFSTLPLHSLAPNFFSFYLSIPVAPPSIPAYLSAEQMRKKLDLGYFECCVELVEDLHPPFRGGSRQGSRQGLRGGRKEERGGRGMDGVVRGEALRVREKKRAGE